VRNVFNLLCQHLSWVWSHIILCIMNQKDPKIRISVFQPEKKHWPCPPPFPFCVGSSLKSVLKQTAISNMRQRRKHVGTPTKVNQQSCQLNCEWMYVCVCVWSPVQQPKQICFIASFCYRRMLIEKHFSMRRQRWRRQNGRKANNKKWNEQKRRRSSTATGANNALEIGWGFLVYMCVYI
jgi:hypothetical protein